MSGHKNIIKRIIHFLLLFTCLCLVYKGPFLRVLNIETTYQNSYMDIESVEQLEWPDIALCLSPPFKNKSRFQEFHLKSAKDEFKDEQEFQSAIEEIFYNQPQDFIQGAFIGSHYSHQMTAADLNATVEMLTVDFDNAGKCAIIRMNIIREKYFNINDGNHKDEDFCLVLYLKIGTSGASPKIRIFPPRETFRVGASATDQYFYSAPGKLHTFALTVEKKEHSSKCNDEINQITSCVERYTEKVFGNDFRNQTQKLRFIQRLKLRGENNLYNVTQCMKPCHQFEYIATEVMGEHDLNDLSSLEPLVQFMDNLGLDYETTAAIGLLHFKQIMVHLTKEVYKYSLMDFIGDAGGTIGIFLGLSFWSLYGDFLEPLFTKLERILQWKK